MRTAAAVVTLLISVVLLHLATPHHTTVSAVSQQAAAQLDISGGEPVGSGCPHRGPVDHHYDSVDGRLARAAHSHSVDIAPPAAVIVDCGSSVVLTGSVHPSTAREGCTPSAAVAPTRAVLQSFRC